MLFGQQVYCQQGSLPEAVRVLEKDKRRKDRRGAFQAEVLRVKDGDSLFVKSNLSEEQIRLFGIDAPELDQPFGTASREFVAKAVLGSRVTVVPFYKDKFGRTIAVVFCADGEVLHQKLVRAGMAWWYRRYDPENKRLEELERQAREKRMGLWSQAAPLKPEEHRRHQFASGQWQVIDGVLYMTKNGKLVPEDEM